MADTGSLGISFPNGRMLMNGAPLAREWGVPRRREAVLEVEARVSQSPPVDAVTDERGTGVQPSLVVQEIPLARLQT